MWIGECNMPLQDDTLREVWASDRSGRSLATYLNPGDPDGGVGRSRNRGGRRIDAFASISGHEEEGGSPEVQRRPKQVCHPHLEMGQKGLPTVSRHKVGNLGGGGPPSAEKGGERGSLEVWFLFLRKEVSAGIGWPGEEFGLWGFGALDVDMMRGRGHPSSPQEGGCSSCPDNPRLFLAAQGIRG